MTIDCSNFVEEEEGCYSWKPGSYKSCRYMYM